MNVIAYVLTKIRTKKNVVRQMSKDSCFRRPYDKQHGKRSKTLLKSAREYVCYICWSRWTKIELEKVSLSDI